MKKRMIPMGLLFIMILLMCAALFWNGNYVVYILSYVFSFTSLFCYAVFSATTIWEKIAQTIVYALIMAVQILFAVLVIRPSGNDELCRLLGTVFLFTPFLVRQIFFLKPVSSTCAAPSLEEWSALSYAQLLHDKEEITDRIIRAQKAGRALSKGQLRGIIQDLPQHRSFSYVNNGSLTREYFEKAQSSLNDGYLYLVLTRSQSAASEVIGLFTKKLYNHISLSFDRELLTVISYNGGERVEPPGLNPELIKSLAGRAGASVMVYRLPASYEQKRMILDKVYEINTEGSAYNLLGLLFKFSYQPNIMFCSQFVYSMLEMSGMNYFEKDAVHVAPTDLVELDYYRKLEFVTEITLHRADSRQGEDINE